MGEVSGQSNVRKGVWRGRVWPPFELAGVWRRRGGVAGVWREGGRIPTASRADARVCYERTAAEGEILQTRGGS